MIPDRMGNIGNTVAYGQITMKGSMNPSDTLNGNMQASHPFSLVLPLQDNLHLVASLKATGKTADLTGAVKLIKGNVECTTCHNPHVQAKDLVSQNFLVKDSSSGQLCLACHDPTRQESGKVNPLADWSTSAHGLSAAKISPQAQLGSYATVAADACISCHTSHNAVGTARLLRGPNEQDCLTCHNGGANISPIVPYSNVASEYTLPKVGHPFPTATNPHDDAEAVLLNNNRHATCVDCHNAHGSEQVQIFPGAPLIRVSQKNVAGINASDGATLLTPAVNQYENCLRCHGSKQTQAAPVADGFGYLPQRILPAVTPYDLHLQFGVASASSHPVMQSWNSSVSLPQPSLLTFMLKLDGTNSNRSMGTGSRILCTDCHNSDDNREFGGPGANGPHGSIYSHILERRYVFSQAPAAGQLISNLALTLNPDLGPTGQYAMCAKCHDIANQIVKNTSWNHHGDHINAGMSCSVCHTAHGVGASNGTISGERLVNFDLNVVASNGGLPISYNHGPNTCVLVCHMTAHNPNGTVTAAGLRSPGIRR